MKDSANLTLSQSFVKIETTSWAKRNMLWLWIVLGVLLFLAGWYFYSRRKGVRKNAGSYDYHIPEELVQADPQFKASAQKLRTMIENSSLPRRRNMTREEIQDLRVKEKHLLDEAERYEQGEHRAIRMAAVRRVRENQPKIEEEEDDLYRDREAGRMNELYDSYGGLRESDRQALAPVRDHIAQMRGELRVMEEDRRRGHIQVGTPEYQKMERLRAEVEAANAHFKKNVSDLNREGYERERAAPKSKSWFGGLKSRFSWGRRR